MRLRYTRRALEQIDKAIDYVGERSPQGAARIRKRVLAVVALLKSNPHAGRATSRLGVRRFSLIPYPYIIDYRVVGDDLIIMRFRHTARRPIE